MPVIGITGGIASGKTTFAEALSRFIPGQGFNADQAVRNLLTEDEDVLAEVRTEFGSGVLNQGGQIDRSLLREIVFNDPQRRLALEAILHPRIRQQWTELADHVRSRGGWLLVDIPLLFETKVEAFFDRVIVVACSARTQLTRLISGRGISAEMAQRIVATQVAPTVRMEAAQHIIWTEGPLRSLEEQSQVLAGYLVASYE